MNHIKKAVDDINEKYSFVMIGGKSRIAHLMDDGRYSFVQIQSFKESFSNKKIEVLDGNKNLKQKSKALVWIDHPDRAEYLQGVEFYPERTADNGKLNLWNGYGYKRKPYEIEKIQPLLRYIKEIVCTNNEEHYAYLMGWIARGFQKPHLPAETVPVLQGEKGTGKGTLGKILAALWGNHSNHISSSKHLVGNFNSLLSNCCFMFADEAFYHGDKAGESVLKAIITEPHLTIEPKGVDAFQVRNCLKILMCANDNWVIPSSRDERRFFCLNVVDSFDSTKKKAQLFNEVYCCKDDDDVMSMFLDYLLSFDIRDFKHRDYPETEENKRQRLHSLPTIAKYLYEACDREYLYNEISGIDSLPSKWYDRVQTDLIMAGLHQWGRDNYKGPFDRPTANEVKHYLRDDLKLPNKQSRGTASYNNKSIGTGNKSGYELGQAIDLKNRIIDYENIPND